MIFYGFICHLRNLCKNSALTFYHPPCVSIQNPTFAPVHPRSKIVSCNRYKSLFQFHSFSVTQFLLLFKPLFKICDLMFVQKSVPALFIFCSFFMTYYITKGQYLQACFFCSKVSTCLVQFFWSLVVSSFVQKLVPTHSVFVQNPRPRSQTSGNKNKSQIIEGTTEQ